MPIEQGSFDVTPKQLSQKQRQILGLYAQGLSRAQILQVANIKRQTLDSHMKISGGKMGARTIRETVIAAFESEQLNIDDFVSDGDMDSIAPMKSKRPALFKVWVTNSGLMGTYGSIPQAANNLCISERTAECELMQANRMLGVSGVRSVVLYYAAKNKGIL